MSAAEFAASEYILMTRAIKTCCTMVSSNPSQRVTILVEFSGLLLTHLQAVTNRLTANNDLLIASNDRRLAALVVS